MNLVLSLSKTILPALLLAFSFTACCNNPKVGNDILQGKQRSERHKARDNYRHPQQTLSFFELAPDQTVVEIWPGGGGWYSEILAPYLNPQGTFYAAHFAADSEIEYFRISLDQYRQKFKDYPEIYDRVILTELQPPDKLRIAPTGTVDRVLTFRNVHNWMRYGQAESVFKVMYDALKPGGILGVVEHRLPVGRDEDPKALSGYVSERQVIALAQQAGFKLLAKSELNANPSDTADHPAGVWTLPPSLRLGDQNRSHYLEIGESDRMTLKFVKP